VQEVLRREGQSGKKSTALGKARHFIVDREKGPYWLHEHNGKQRTTQVGAIGPQPKRHI
jgi:hypothetical protein